MRSLSAIVLATGCATAVDDRAGSLEPGPYVDETGEAVPQAGTARLRDTTVILPALVSKDITVDFDHLLVPAAGNEDLLALARGTVLVSGTGDGFIRKVYTATLDADTRGYPVRRLRDLPAGEYWVQPFVNVYTRFPRADGKTVWLHDDRWEGQQWKISNLIQVI